MLLAAIVQLMFWIIGVIAHSQNFQRVFQANTVRDRKVFSYFYLGQKVTPIQILGIIIICFGAYLVFKF
jgi:drug/metabolite transporter (DMT)-like permease